MVIKGTKIKFKLKSGKLRTGEIIGQEKGKFAVDPIGSSRILVVEKKRIIKKF